MDVKRSFEILSLIAGILLAAQVLMDRKASTLSTSLPVARQVDNISTLAPRTTNYLGDSVVQARIQAAIDRGPYHDYSQWRPGMGGL